jgi:CheY-like chemotaxis protein
MSPEPDRSLVLLVDDAPDTCAVLAGLLQRQGYETRQATSGAECLAAIAREPVSLVLLDVVMPGLDGFAVCRALRRLSGPHRPPVVLMTGHDSLAVRREGIRHGACEFLTKPIAPDALLARVRRQLHVAALGRGLARLERRLDRAAQATGRFQSNVARAPAMRWHCDPSITKLKISARRPHTGGDPGGWFMAKEDDVLIQLATRIPKGLHREIKLYCVHSGISVMEFVAAALEEKLRKAGKPARRTAAR